MMRFVQKMFQKLMIDPGRPDGNRDEGAGFHGWKASLPNGRGSERTSETGSLGKGTRRVHYARLVWMAGMILCLGAGVYGWSCYHIDRVALRSLALMMSRSESDSGAKAISLMEWVHQSSGSRGNRHWFGRPAWRATPLQVAMEGGDCADKSRLLVALLAGIDIPATPVLCMDAATQAPAHTLVEAEVSPGRFMALDAAFNLYFPKSSGGYHGILDLRADPGIVDRRVADIQRSDGAQAQNEYYLRSGADYQTATTVNWNRGPVTRWAHTFLAHWMGENLYRLRRPVWLEDPQLKSCIAWWSAGGALAVAVGLIRLAAPGRTHRLARHEWRSRPFSGRRSIAGAGGCILEPFSSSS